jgi:plastocyanin
MRIRLLFVAGAALVVLGGAMPAYSFHWYRSTDNGCAANDGALTDDPVDEHGNIVHGPLATTIQLLHNAFKDEATGTSLTGFEIAESTTTIAAGQSLTWTWNSAHCHSVTFEPNAAFGGPAPDSGFFYPTTAPDSPQVLPGAFEYPILSESPTLSWRHTFSTPGTFSYFCVHHASIGMVGTIVVV